MNRRGPTHRTRRGVTLIELLVVVFIILLITAIAIPIVAPSGDERQLRETSRLVTSHFQGARTRAIQSGRPFGVIIEPLAGETRAALQLSYAEVQPSYAGDFIASRVTVDPSTGEVTFVSGDVGWQALVKVGDVLKLDYQGHYYPIQNFDLMANTLTIGLPPTTSTPPNVPATGLPFQIIRQPVKTAAPPLELPTGMAIDLEYSGAPGSALNQLTDETGPYGIIFTPGGAIAAIYHGGGLPNPVIPTGPIFLLIGKREYIPSNLDYNPPDDPVQYNYQDFTNVWVTIQHQTGLVSSTEVADSANVTSSRALAYKALTLGGK